MSGRVTVSRLPPCDIHPDRLAAYDAKTKRGPWANLCPECFVNLGLGLGTGLGQRLILEGSECYSDHAEDIRTKGSCDYCGGTK